ncbi:hypothetical protein [Ruminococcus sp.]|uniref:hypothetical protein n=1 Tax=Ruminococcus sp. TaxID=41978 RepID=UPI0025D7BA2C|nr:hypothetical protein [Ruminococcus sp.]MBQ8965178.1 hypothetical protein [Ruminococcus sp.]
MIKLSFEKMTPESIGALKRDIEPAAAFEDIVSHYKGVCFALHDGEKYTAAAAMIFEMNDDVLTTALRKLYLTGLYVSDKADEGHEGMMLEYTVEQAMFMGYDLLTVRVSTDDIKRIKFFASHGFDKIVRADEDENGRAMILQRDIKMKIKCCGFYA